MHDDSREVPCCFERRGMAPAAHQHQCLQGSLVLAILLLLAGVPHARAGSDCTNATHYPWLCLPIQGSDFHGAPPHRTFTILLCSGPLCAPNIDWGPRSVKHRIVDRLVLFNANLPNSEILELPRRWLQDIRIRDLVFIDTKLRPQFLTDELLLSQNSFLSGLTAQNCSIGGTLSVDGDQAQATSNEYNTTISPAAPVIAEEHTKTNSSTINSSDDKQSKTSSTKEAKAAVKNRMARWIGLDNSFRLTEADEDSNYTTTMPMKQTRFRFRNTNVTIKPVPVEHRNRTVPVQPGHPANISSGASIVTRSLRYVTRLYRVDLSHNKITGVAGRAFPNGLNRLRLLQLSHNNIETISSQAFANLPVLAQLDLSHNKLQAISRDVFDDPNSSLESLDLSSNLLSALPGDIFKSMFALKELGLANNYLQQLPSATWMPVWNQLTVLTLTGNFIACDCDTIWIRERLPPSASINGTCSYPDENEGASLREFPKPQMCT